MIGTNGLVWNGWILDVLGREWGMAVTNRRYGLSSTGSDCGVWGAALPEPVERGNGGYKPPLQRYGAVVGFSCAPRQRSGALCGVGRHPTPPVRALHPCTPQSDVSDRENERGTCLWAV